MRGLRKEHVVVLETHIDHLTGEELGHAFDRLLEAGAVDALWIPGIMKKNRPGGAFRVICRPENEEAVLAAFFRHTHTLGIRRQVMERLVLPREQARARLGGNVLGAKRYELEGESYLRPEHDELAREAAARGLGLPGLRFRGQKSARDDSA